MTRSKTGSPAVFDIAIASGAYSLWPSLPDTVQCLLFWLIAAKTNWFYYTPKPHREAKPMLAQFPKQQIYQLYPAVAFFLPLYHSCHTKWSCAVESGLITTVRPSGHRR